MQFWHNFDGPFYSNNGTHSTLPLMAYIYLPFSAHLYTQLPIGMHVPFQPNIAQNSFLPLLADMSKLVELAYQPKMDRNSFGNWCEGWQRWCLEKWELRSVSGRRLRKWCEGWSQLHFPNLIQHVIDWTRWKHIFFVFFIWLYWCLNSKLEGRHIGTCEAVAFSHDLS